MTHPELQPDPRFIVDLENRLTQEYRRRERLGPIDETSRDAGKWLRAAALTLAGLCLGAASVTLAQRLEDAGRLELLQRQAESSVRIAAERVDVNRRIAQTAAQQAEQGIAPMAAAYPAQVELIAAELQHALAERNLDEILTGGRAVRNEISAPRVGGRDFVSERLRLELDANRQLRSLLEPVLEFNEARVRVGLNPEGSRGPLEIERGQLAASADRLGETLALRQAFLAGEVSAEQAEISFRLLLAMTRRLTAEAQLNELRTANESIRRRYELGVITESDLYLSEREILQAEADVEMAAFEIELLTQELTP